MVMSHKMASRSNKNLPSEKPQLTSSLEECEKLKISTSTVLKADDKSIKETHLTEYLFKLFHLLIMSRCAGVILGYHYVLSFISIYYNHLFLLFTSYLAFYFFLFYVEIYTHMSIEDEIC